MTCLSWKKLFDCFQQEFNLGHLINTFNALLIIYRGHVIIPIMYRRHVMKTIKLSVRPLTPPLPAFKYRCDALPDNKKVDVVH